MTLRFVYLLLLWIALSLVGVVQSIRNNNNHNNIKNNPIEYDYITTSISDLGYINPDSTIGNPYKGFIDHIEFPHHNTNIATNIYDISLEAYYIGLDEIVINNPDIVGIDNAFNWTALERRLDHAASYNRHVVVTIMCHYPNWNKVSIPQYLMEDDDNYNAMELLYYPDFLGGGYSPDYNHPKFLHLIQIFIREYGKRYDTDPRIGFIHLGLLGFWGEWHTYPYNHFISDHTKELVIQWYQNAFTHTKLLIRYPMTSAYRAGFGLIDSSFTYETLDGDDNGGQVRNHYFWPSVISSHQTNFWRNAPMGGETRPEQQSIIFESSYPNGTYQKQDFIKCVTTTHASYIAHHDMFIDSGYNGIELENSLYAHVRMGYNFVITQVATKLPQNIVNDTTIRIDVTVQQIGVAPFYYPLSILLHCPELDEPIELKGVETIIDQYDTKNFIFHNVPRTESCMRDVSFSLYSSRGYRNRPIKFAQGQNGKVQLEIPIPSKLEDVPDEDVKDDGSITNTTSTTNMKPLYMMYRLINTETDIDEGYSDIKNGMTIDLDQVGRSLTIQVYVYDDNAEIQSNIQVQFQYNDMTHTEFRYPYTLNGKLGTNYIINGYISKIGTKLISAKVMSHLNRKVVLLDDILLFNVIDSTSDHQAPVPTPTSFLRLLTTNNNNNNNSSIDDDDGITTQLPPSIAEMHGFNIPGTPSILELEDTRRKRVFLYHIVIPILTIITVLIVVGSSVILYRQHQCKKLKIHSSTEVHKTTTEKAIMKDNWEVVEGSPTTTSDNDRYMVKVVLPMIT